MFYVGGINYATQPFLLSLFSADDYATGSLAQLTITYPATPNIEHYIRGVAWSFAEVPVAPQTYLAVGSSLVGIFWQYITQDGVGTIYFPTPVSCGEGANLIVVMQQAGGGASNATLNVLGHFTRLVV